MKCKKTKHFFIVVVHGAKNTEVLSTEKYPTEIPTKSQTTLRIIRAFYYTRTFKRAGVGAAAAGATATAAVRRSNYQKKRVKSVVKLKENTSLKASI